ncbi:hypothetical protein [Emticicia fontis]
MSTQIKNVENLSVADVRNLVNQGGKFVIFPYTISIVVMTFQRSSDIYFIRPDESSFKHSAGYLLMNFFLGWWGIPWGPIYTIGALFTQLSGGKDVTQEVMTHLIQNDPNAATNTYNVPNPNASTPSGAPAYNIPGAGSASGSTGGSSNSPYNIQ